MILTNYLTLNLSFFFTLGHATLRQGVDFFATKKFGLSGQISKIADKGQFKTQFKYEKR